jgi:hypothetical protein
MFLSFESALAIVSVCFGLGFVTGILAYPLLRPSEK